jgi:methanethiol S-methyltransferase
VKKPIYFVYGVVSHIIVLACFAYYGLWNYRAVVAKNIDSGAVGDPVVSFILNLVILAAYCAAHSLLARWSFKQWLRRRFPQLLERATYCLFFSVLLVGLCFAWRPIPRVLWQVTSPAGLNVMLGLCLFSWALHFASIFWINYWEFFGIRQTWLASRGESYFPPAPQTRRDFAISHILLIVSLSMIPWMVPKMSVGQLFFCSFVTIYNVIGAWLSGRDTSDLLDPVPDTAPPEPARV